MGSISEFLDVGQNSKLNFGFFDSKGIQAGLLASGPLPDHLSHILLSDRCAAAVLVVDQELGGVVSLVTRAVKMLQVRLKMHQKRRLLLEVSKERALFLHETLLKIGLIHFVAIYKQYISDLLISSFSPIRPQRS